MTRRLLILSTIAILSTLTAFGARAWYRSHRILAQVKRATELAAKLPPVVAARISFQEILRTPGKPDLLSTEREFAISSDGSEVWIDKQHANTGHIYMTHWHMRLSDGTRAEGDDVTHSMTAVKLPVPPAQVALERWTPGSSCTVQANGIVKTPDPAGHETILGMDTVKIAVGDTPTSRTTVWRALGLNCIELRRLAEFKNADGSIRDTSELIATSVTRGEPDASQFLLPSGHDNVTYSERFKRQVAALQNRTPSDNELQAITRQDAVFNEFKIQ